MVNGLLIDSKDGFRLELKNLNPIEEFEQLDLINKYGFQLGWYKFGQNIHVISKKVIKGERQIYLAEKTIDAESIINRLVNELVEQFQIRPEEQKQIFTLLKEHGCCFF